MDTPRRRVGAVGAVGSQAPVSSTAAGSQVTSQARTSRDGRGTCVQWAVMVVVSVVVVGAMYALMNGHHLVRATRQVTAVRWGGTPRTAAANGQPDASLAGDGTDHKTRCGGLPCAVRGSERKRFATAESRVVMPLPYGSELPFSEKMAREALVTGLASSSVEKYRGLGAGEGVVVERVIGGGIVNAVYRAVLENGRTVYVKLGSPFWRGCGKALSEAAAQQYVAAHTKIPVPQVLAVQDARWVLASDNATVVDVLEADGRGLEVRLAMPDIIIMEAAPGVKLKDVLARPDTDVSPAQRSQLFAAWADVFRQLRELPFDAYGSFLPTTPVTVGPLATNGGCSGLGPLDTYPQYAAARVEMFLPLIAGGACVGDRFKVYVPRLRCLANRFRRAPEDPSLHPVLLHTDMSMRNVLVAMDEEGGGPRITSVLDWEFAVAGPAEEEFTFDATLDGLTPRDVQLFRDTAAHIGVPMPQPGQKQPRKDHIAVYWTLITFCHAHAWKDDPLFTSQKREESYLREERKLLRLLQRNGC